MGKVTDELFLFRPQRGFPLPEPAFRFRKEIDAFCQFRQFIVPFNRHGKIHPMSTQGFHPLNDLSQISHFLPQKK